MPALRLLSLILICAVAGPAAAHPHIFVDAGLRLAVDGAGRATGVEVTWEYDELYSLFSFEDLGLDPDYDGKLTGAELAQLDGFDLHWVPGYEGDLYLETGTGAGTGTGSRPVPLGKPEGRGVSVHQGRIRSVHFRPLPQPVPAAGLVLRVYDPTYYTSYSVALGVTAGQGCRAEVIPPDLDAADERLKAILAEIPADQTETDFPAVGANFADTVVIRCAG